MSELKTYTVWDPPTRLFHWINAICAVLLVVVGYLILNARTFEIPRTGSLKLKTVHTWIGYVFVVNLAIRIVWAFVGNRYARWRAILPGGRGYLSALGSYIRAFLSRRPEHYLGHNPLGRLSVTAMLLLIAVLAISGLVLAGTDLFYPPLGHWMAQWVAAPGLDPASLAPNSPAMYDKASFDSMRAFRKPFILAHLYAYYALLVIVSMHIVGAVVSEIREGGNSISATFTGRKILSENPADA
ncbi:MAG: cytochrome b/b6 domain-containing protein [Planctomycetota bacterium]|nr:cytochrome b/b6 domain-containing protein [Planctomycetota bacterium]